MTVAADGALVAAQARSWLGTPYVHQAACRGAGSDCLGLIRGVWATVVGNWPAPMPAYTADWNETCGQEDLLHAARRYLLPAASPLPHPGDVLLFRMRRGCVAKHLGIVVEGGAEARFVHAYSGHGVVENALSEAWAARVAARFVFPVRYAPLAAGPEVDSGDPQRSGTDMESKLQGGFDALSGALIAGPDESLCDTDINMDRGDEWQH